MAARDYPSVDSNDSRTSRRGLLRALATAPITAAAMSPKSPWSDALTSLHEDYGDEPVIMTRTKDGRALSRRRYHIAEGFFPDQQQATGFGWHDYLYKAGITAQLALSSHLLDVGFPDAGTPGISACASPSHWLMPMPRGWAMIVPTWADWQLSSAPIGNGTGFACLANRNPMTAVSRSSESTRCCARCLIACTQ